VESIINTVSGDLDLSVVIVWGLVEKNWHALRVRGAHDIFYVTVMCHVMQVDIT
jgi:hypothetical protein